MTTSSPCQLHMGASPHTPEVLRIEAKWMGEKKKRPGPWWQPGLHPLGTNLGARVAPQRRPILRVGMARIKRFLKDGTMKEKLGENQSMKLKA